MCCVSVYAPLQFRYSTRSPVDTGCLKVIDLVVVKVDIVQGFVGLEWLEVYFVA